MIDDDDEGVGDPSVEAKYNGLVLEYQDIIKALEEIEGVGGSQFTHGPFTPAELIRVLGEVLKENSVEIDRLKKKCGEDKVELPKLSSIKPIKRYPYGG